MSQFEERTNELRFRTKSTGQRILQQLWEIYPDEESETPERTEWRDVPMTNEEK